MSIVDAGFIFSGAIGTGILIGKLPDGSWSNPVACGMTGVGFGLLLGIQTKELIMFLPDNASVQAFFSSGVKLGAKINATVGIGREMDVSLGASLSGISDPVVFAYSKGAFGGVSLEGAVVSPRKAVNQTFYGTSLEPVDIIEGKVSFPSNKETLWPNVLDKLGKLAKGLTELPEDEKAEQVKIEAARVAADTAAEEIHEKAEEDVVMVDAEAEATKESS